MAVIMSKIFTLPGSNGGSGGVSGTLASDLAVGTSVFLNVGGVSTEFLVVHQGNPDTSLYDASCDGTWLLMKDIYETKPYDSYTEPGHTSSSSIYDSSTIHYYLYNTFILKFDEDVQEAIKTVKIPYYNAYVRSGEYGLPTKLFLLTGYEIGITQSMESSISDDGACLSYFKGSSTTNAKRIAYLNGTANEWWIRSVDTDSTKYCYYIDKSGAPNVGLNNYNNSYGVRPALILPSNALFDSDTREFKGVA